MAQKGKRIMAAALVPFAVVNIYAGCKWHQNNQRKDTKPESKSVIVEKIEYQDRRGISTSSIGETRHPHPEVEKTCKDNIFSKLQTIYETSGKTIEELLASENKMSEHYVAGLYAKLKSFDLSDEVIRTEIENILKMSLTFTDIDEETWMRLFEKLETTINEYDNVIDYYYPLAIYVHTSECELTHNSCELDDSRITCATLEQMASSAFSDISYAEYVKDRIEASENQELIKEYQRINDAGIKLEDVLKELENIYELAQIPMCIDEDTWNELFKNLLTTVNEYDNVFQVYASLAKFVHELNCDYTHSINEYGANVCDGKILKYK